MSTLRHLEALAKKAVSFQKRQYTTNIICILGCPVSMILIAFTLNQVIYNAIQASFTGLNTEYLFCSNVKNQNKINLPYWTYTSLRPSSAWPSESTSDNSFPGSTQSVILMANFVFLNGFWAGPFPCTFQFGLDYQKGGDIYNNPTTVNVSSPNLLRDTTMLSQPLSAWIPSILNGSLIDGNSYNIFLQFQQRTNALIAFDANFVNPADIGTKPKQPDLVGPFPNSSLLLLASLPSTNTSEKGLLATFPTRYYLATDSKVITPTPFYSIIPPNTRGNIEYYLDDLIAESLNGVMQDLQQMNAGTYAAARRRSVSLNQLAASVLVNLTHGAIYFRKLDHETKSYAWDFYFGTAKILSTTQAFPSPGQRSLYHQTMLSNAILRNGNLTSFGNATITQTLRALPQIGKTIVVFQLMAYLGVILFPFGVSFLLPVFAVILVQEKELRILIMMKMNGLNEYLYYCSQYVTFYILYCLSAFLFVLAGKAAQLNFFTVTDNAVLLLIFFIWGHVLVLLSFLFSTLFKSSRNALIIVFLVVLCSIQVGLAINHMYVESNQYSSNSRPPLGYFIWPPFAFYRIIGKISYASYTPNVPGFKLKNLVSGNEVYDALIFMVVSIPIIFILFLYLNAIVPTDFGIRKPWYFPFLYIWQALPFHLLPSAFIRNGTPLASSKKKEHFKSREFALKVNIDDDVEDPDVKKERAIVSDPSFDATLYPLVLRNMRKVYAGRGGQPPKLAVRDITLKLDDSTVFGLLG